MAEYKIFFRESVEKDFKGIPKKELNKILEKIRSLSNVPRPTGSEKLTDRELFRVRQGRYRILYSVQDHDLSIWIVKVGHRKDIYR